MLSPDSRRGRSEAESMGSKDTQYPFTDPFSRIRRITQCWFEKPQAKAFGNRKCGRRRRDDGLGSTPGLLLLYEHTPSINQTSSKGTTTLYYVHITMEKGWCGPFKAGHSKVSRHPES